MQGLRAACVLVVLGLVSVHGGRLSIQGNHFVKDGQRVFLSGANTAWASYAYDFGNSQYQYRRTQYLHRLDLVKNAGGNSMRTWVHVEGQTSPQFDNNGHVTGLDRDGTFISDFKRYLDDAQARGILVFATLWNGAVSQQPAHLRGLITDTARLQSYLDHALIPWVRAVKDHPAMGGWDVINEMEGFIQPDHRDSQPCFDTTFLHNSGAGWAGKLYSAHDLLRFINWQVDAIRRTDPDALVTAGSWSERSQTDQLGQKNLYSDDCLSAAGGKTMGNLTFYSTHSYAWHGQFNSASVFKHRYADYGLDRPLVVAEFMTKDNSGAGMTSAQMFTYVYSHGYHGAWIWSDEPEASQSAGIHAISGKHGHNGVVSISV